MSDHLFKRGSIWYCWAPDAHGHLVKRSTRCTDRRAAAAFLARFERRLADPVAAAAESATLVDALVALIRDRQARATNGSRSQETVEFYRRKTGQLRAHFGDDFRLAELDATAVDDFITARRESGIGENTIAKELGTLRAALRLARRAKLWAGHHADVLPLDFATGYRARDRWLTDSEVRLVLGTLTPDRAARVAFFVATSARDGEAARAERSDVDENLVALRGTKTARAKRQVPLVTEWQRELVAYALEHAAGVAKLFAPWGNMRRDLIAAAERVGIERFSPNDLRRTHSHWLKADGVPRELLQHFLGHTSPRMADTTYARPTAAELAEQASRWIAAYLGKPVGRTATESAESAARAGRTSAPKGRGKQAISVPRDGIEPPTRGFSIPCSTN